MKAHCPGGGDRYDALVGVGVRDGRRPQPVLERLVRRVGGGAGARPARGMPPQILTKMQR